MRLVSDNSREKPRSPKLRVVESTHARLPAALPKRMRLRDGRVILFPAIMGVLNVTPDSFSDGGRYLGLRPGDRACDLRWKRTAQRLSISAENRRGP